MRALPQLIDGNSRLCLAANTPAYVVLAVRDALVVAFVSGKASGRRCRAGIVCAVGRAAFEVAEDVVGDGSGVAATLGSAAANAGDVSVPRAVLAE